MNKLKIKESYLILLIVVSLVSLGIYTTYALFTASTTINDVVGITATLDIGKSMSEYEVVTVPAGETKLIELNVVNSYNGNIYYGAWYQIVKGNSDNIQIGLYTERNSNPGSGSLSSSSNINLLVGITNDNSTSVTLYIGVKGSLTNELNLGTNKILIPDGFSEALLVTEEVLEAHKETKTNNVKLEYTTPQKTEVILKKGTYKLEAWGALKGGYSYGTITLPEDTTVFVYPGGVNGFNGGGTGYTGTIYWLPSTCRYQDGWDYGSYTSKNGGGATDIRIGTDSLYARVIVAGGGSGGENAGGGISGGGNSFGNGAAGTSGTIYAGSDCFKPTTYTHAGGGGWYGGTQNVGGSGWVYTESFYNNWKLQNSSDASNWLLNSKYYLDEAATASGSTSFTDFSGSTVTGHSGNGAVRISGTATVITYTIPNLTGLTDLTLSQGTSIDLTTGTKLTCANNTTTGCSITNILPSDTATLSVGSHIITYTVTDSNNNKYYFARNVAITS